MLTLVPAVLEEARNRRLSKISIEPDPEAVFVANGVTFPPKVPAWIAYFELVGDAIEYNLHVEARNAREARSLALLRLKDAGVDVDTMARAA
jgi:hypothetical protein